MTLSVLGQTWTLAEAKRAAALAQGLALPEVVARVLDVRQPCLEMTDLLAFLTPKLTQLPDPSHFLDMDVAVARIVQAIKNQEQIAVFGDYDVDGACASAVLLRYFRQLGLPPKLYIPDRLSEGYGPNPQAINLLADAGVTLIITVDCGSTAHPALEAAQQRSVDVVVTDHHQAPLPLPPCVGLVNPNRVDETSPCTMLCGAGLAFFLLMAVNRALRTQGFFAERQEPDLRPLLDLVALATICDMVPLVGVNRVLTHYGLKVMNQWRNAGLHAIAQVASIAQADTYAAGFQIGPRLNAAGRLSDCSLGATLLSTDDPQEAQHLADRLNKLNATRQEVQADVTEAALAEAATQAEENAIIVTGQGWHPGVVGIVAARIKEKFYRPTFVLAVGEDGTATGSGRSIKGIDLGRAVHASMATLERGGGHAMAAGVTVAQDKVADFTAALRAHVAEQITQQPDVFTPALRIDGILQPASATEHLLTNLAQLAPYGTGHREPMFALSGVIVQDVRMVGSTQAHAKLRLQGADGATVDAICFGAGENALGDFFQQHRGQKISVAGQLKANTFNGRTRPDFQVKDAVAGNWQA